MLTIILTVTSDATDIEYYKNAVGNSAALHIVSAVTPTRDAESPTIIEKHNKIIEESDSSSDILLLSDQVDLHGDFDKFIANMRDCLYAAEKHALVYSHETENRESLIKTAKRYLPRYSVNIDEGAFCVLIKRDVLKLLGLFNTEYSSIEYALMDFYYSINQYGFSAITAHHSLYSFNERKCIHESSADKEKFTAKFPYSSNNEIRYARYSNPCKKFLRVLDEDYYQKKRILFDCRVMPLHHCGISEYQISLYNAFYNLYNKTYDIFMLVTHQADDYHKLSDRLSNIIYPDTIEGEFHIGLSPSQLLFLEGQTPLNKHCLKIVQTVHDIIMIRSDEFFSKETNQIYRASDVETGISISDGIVFISDFTKNDFLARLAHIDEIKNKQLKVIYNATGFRAPDRNDYELPFDEYYLIIGNSLKHKAIAETIEAVKNLRHNFIVIGGDGSHNEPNIHSFQSGHLDEDFLSYIYASCKAIIFPSLYEGFGLPIVIGFNFNKHVIVKNNSLNRELRDHFSQFSEYFHFFNHFDDIGTLIEDLDFSALSATYDDSWERVAAEYESFFAQIIEEQTDMENLQERYRLFSRFDSLITQRDAEIHRRDSTIQQRDSTIQERDSIIRERDETIHQHNMEIRELHGIIHHHRLEIVEFRNAFWWRITKPARVVMDNLKSIWYRLNKVDESVNITRSLTKRKARPSEIPQNIHIRSDKILEKERKYKFAAKPLFSICVPLYNTPRGYLTDMITSVQSQTYANWELILADGSEEGDVADYCKKYTQSDSRIRYIKLTENKGISANTNEAICAATGDYIGFMDHDDILHPSLLFELTKVINTGDADFIYTDEAVVNDSLDKIEYLKLKADFSLYELRAHNYICHFVACKRELLESVGYLRGEFDGSQDHDLVLRLSEKAQKIVHIPQILYYWRMHKDSVAYSLDTKDYAVKSAIDAIGQHLDRCGIHGEVDSSHPHRTIYRVSYINDQSPQVHIIVHGTDCDMQIKRCIAEIERKSGYLNLNVLTADSHELKNKMWDGEYLLFLDASLSEASPGFVSEMLMYARQNDVGAVGPMLLYRDNAILSAGISLFSESKSGLKYWYHEEHLESGGYELCMRHVRETTGTWAGCMLVRGDVFKAVGGFKDSPDSYEGIDFCLKLRQKGLATVWTPYAEMCFNIDKQDIACGIKIASTKEFLRKWKSEYIKGDPHYHPLFNELEMF